MLQIMSEREPSFVLCYGGMVVQIPKIERRSYAIAKLRRTGIKLLNYYLGNYDTHIFDF